MPPTQVAGDPGTAIFNGYIEETELNPKLKGVTKYQTYSDILANLTIVSTGTRYFLNLVARASWKVEPSDADDAEAVELAERVEFIMSDMRTPWYRVVRRAAMYRFYGFSIQEWVAKLNDDGVIGFDDVEPRAQITIERWDRNEETGVIDGMVQRSPQTQEELYLPRQKVIYVVDDTLNDSPEGLGLFRNLVQTANRLARFEQLEGYGFETDLAGIPVGRAPFTELRAMVEAGEITAEQRTAIEQPLRNFLQNRVKNMQTSLYLDSATYRSNDETETPSAIKQWDLELLKTASQSQDSVARTIERLTGEIARLLSIEGLLLGSRDQGSQALSQDKSQNTALVVDSTLKELEETFNKDFIDTLWELNGWPVDKKPSFKTEATQFKDPVQISQVLANLASAGSPMALDDPADDDLRDLLGLSLKPADLGLEADSSLLGGGQPRAPRNIDENMGNGNDT